MLQTTARFWQRVCLYDQSFYFWWIYFFENWKIHWLKLSWLIKIEVYYFWTFQTIKRELFACQSRLLNSQDLSLLSERRFMAALQAKGYKAQKPRENTGGGRASRNDEHDFRYTFWEKAKNLERFFKLTVTYLST